MISYIISLSLGNSGSGSKYSSSELVLSLPDHIIRYLLYDVFTRIHRMFHQFFDQSVHNFRFLLKNLRIFAVFEAIFKQLVYSFQNPYHNTLCYFLYLRTLNIFIKNFHLLANIKRGQNYLMDDKAAFFVQILQNIVVHLLKNAQIFLLFDLFQLQNYFQKPEKLLKKAFFVQPKDILA